MRVTTLIKDYITSEVNKKVNEKINSLPNPRKDDYDALEKELKELQKEVEKRASEIAKKYGFSKNKNKWLSCGLSTYGIEYERDDPYAKESERLRKEAKNKIAEIIIDLELGNSNKKQIQDILENVEF